LSIVKKAVSFLTGQINLRGKHLSEPRFSFFFSHFFARFELARSSRYISPLF
jgi:hypothetical protein